MNLYTTTFYEWIGRFSFFSIFSQNKYIPHITSVLIHPALFYVSFRKYIILFRFIKEDTTPRFSSPIGTPVQTILPA